MKTTIRNIELAFGVRLNNLKSMFIKLDELSFKIWIKEFELLDAKIKINWIWNLILKFSNFLAYDV